MTTQQTPEWFKKFEEQNAKEHAPVAEQLSKLNSKVDSVYALASATSTYENDLPNTMTRILNDELSKTS